MLYLRCKERRDNACRRFLYLDCKITFALANLSRRYKMRRHYARWSEDEISTLLDRYETTPSGVIAAELGRSYQAITGKMVELGLRRSDESIKVNQRHKVWQRRLSSGLSPGQIARIRCQVGCAIGRSDIVKSPCAVCGEVRADAHHEDYSKPLDVVFLCRHHHGVLHALKNQGYDDALSILRSAYAKMPDAIREEYRCAQEKAILLREEMLSVRRDMKLIERTRKIQWEDREDIQLHLL